MMPWPSDFSVLLPSFNLLLTTVGSASAIAGESYLIGLW